MFTTLLSSFVWTGKVLDQYRIDVTLATMYNIIERGGRLIIMTHIGRPCDKKHRTLTVKEDESVNSVVAYLQRKLRIKFVVPQFPVTEGEGIHVIDTSINWLIHDLRNRKIEGIYLPNTRWFSVSGLKHNCSGLFLWLITENPIFLFYRTDWTWCYYFQGEEDKGANMERFIVQLAGLADVFVNDAFGSWQPHGSTYHITKYLPSYAGLCMQVVSSLFLNASCDSTALAMSDSRFRLWS